MSWGNPMKGLREATRQLRMTYPNLAKVERIGRARGAFRFEFYVLPDGMTPAPADSGVVHPQRAVGVRLWRTDLVILYPNGATQFSTGGWHTHTTRAYMSRALRGTPFAVGITGDGWVVLLLGAYAEGVQRAQYIEVPLEDGMVL